MPVFSASHLEHVGHVTRGWPVGVLWREAGTGCSFVGQDDVDFARTAAIQGYQEGRGRRLLPVFLYQLHEGEFACAIDGDIEI